MKKLHIPLMAALILAIWTLDVLFYKNKFKLQNENNKEMMLLSFKEGLLRGSLNYQEGKTFTEQWPADSVNFVKSSFK